MYVEWIMGCDGQHIVIWSRSQSSSLVNSYLDLGTRYFCLSTGLICTGDGVMRVRGPVTHELMLGLLIMISDRQLQHTRMRREG